MLNTNLSVIVCASEPSPDPGTSTRLGFVLHPWYVAFASQILASCGWSPQIKLLPKNNICLRMNYIVITKEQNLSRVYNEIFKHGFLCSFWCYWSICLERLQMLYQNSILILFLWVIQMYLSAGCLQCKLNYCFRWSKLLFSMGLTLAKLPVWGVQRLW